MSDICRFYCPAVMIWSSLWHTTCLGLAQSPAGVIVVEVVFRVLVLVARLEKDVVVKFMELTKHVAK